MTNNPTKHTKDQAHTHNLNENVSRRRSFRTSLIKPSSYLEYKVKLRTKHRLIGHLIEYKIAPLIQILCLGEI